MSSSYSISILSWAYNWVLEQKRSSCINHSRRRWRQTWNFRSESIWVSFQYGSYRLFPNTFIFHVVMTAIAIAVFAVFSASKALAVEFEASGILAVAVLSSRIHWLEVDSLSRVGRWKINTPRVLILWDCLRRHLVSRILGQIVAEIPKCQLRVYQVLLVLVSFIRWLTYWLLLFYILSDIPFRRLYFSHLKIIPWHL